MSETSAGAPKPPTMTVHIEPSEVEGRWTIHALEPDIVTMGDSPTHALRMLAEAIELVERDGRPAHEAYERVMAALKRERAAFDAMRPELVRAHGRGWVVVHGGVVHGLHIDYGSAISAGWSRFGLDEPFLVVDIEDDGSPMYVPSFTVERRTSSVPAPSAPVPAPMIDLANTIAWEAVVAGDDGDVQDRSRLYARVDLGGLGCFHVVAIQVHEVNGTQVAVGSDHQAELDRWGDAAGDPAFAATAITFDGETHRYAVFLSPVAP